MTDVALETPGPIATHRDRLERVRGAARLGGITRMRANVDTGAKTSALEVTIVIGAIERTIEVRLVDRRHMVFRMLLGRSSLAGFLVDPSHSRLLSSR